ncbi:MAG: response regulator [Desulfatibacillaceae bacterium]
MPKEVLIVDDEDLFLNFLTERLAKYQDAFNVHTATDGVTAIKKMETCPVSVVIADIRMPQMDGFVLLANVMEKYPEIPVILMTGHSNPEVKQYAQKGGAIGLIEKPFEIEDLARHTLKALKRESEGGTLHGVSSGMFLQLIEMEERSCTIRLENKQTGKQGVMFFKDGELLDARVDHFKGEDAAKRIFSWDEVTISIQNGCARKVRTIHSGSQGLLMEAMRLKDEGGLEDEELRPEPEPPKTTREKPPKAKQAPSESQPATQATPAPAGQFADRIRDVLAKDIGPKHGLEDIQRDSAWNEAVESMEKFGNLFGAGSLKAGYIDREGALDFIVVPGEETYILYMDPKCPRDRILLTLMSM